MAIREIFPTNIVIKDIDLTQDQILELTVAVESIFLHNYNVTREEVRSSKNPMDKGNFADPIPVFTEENLKVFSELKYVKEIFIDGFYELSQSYEDSDLSRDAIKMLFENSLGQLPVMRTGQAHPAHTHPGAVASAIFYLTDVDNKKDGGQLILRDPTWHSTPGFRNSMQYEIETKAGRLVVFPVHVWHEVKTYLGEKDRIAIVANLSLMNSELLNYVSV